MKLLLTSFLFFSITTYSFGQIQFQQAHSGIELNELLGTPSVTVPIESGGYMTATSSQESPNYYNLLIRLDENGDTLWTKEYPISNIRHPRFIEQDLYGDVLIVGSYDIPQQNWADEVYYLKVDTLGNLLDNGSISGNGGNSSWYYPIGGIEIAYDSTYLIGQKNWGLSSNNSNLRKYNSTFNMQSWITFGLNYNMNNFHENADHSVILAGEGYAQFSSQRNGRIFKTDENLNYIFFKDYKFPGAEHSYFSDIVEIENGYAIIGKYEDAAGDMHSWLAKTDVNGDTTLNVDFPQDVLYKYIFTNANDDLVLFGIKADINSSYNFYMSVLDTNFVFSEHHEYPYSGSNGVYSVQPTLDGGYVLSGNGVDPVDSSGAAYVLKIGPDYCIPAVVGVNDFIQNQTICDGDSINFGGNFISGEGIYNGLYTGATGCDSSVLLNLFVSPVDTSYMNSIICSVDSVIVGDSTYMQTGNYTTILTSTIGCDSVVILDLISLPAPLSSNPTISICYGDSFSLGSGTYNSPGSYSETIQNSYGCDSTVNFDLFIYPYDTLTVDATICSGESYSVGTNWFTQSGSFTAYTSNMNGCDSIIYLTLNVLPPDTATIYQTICEGESVTFGGQNFTQNGSYAYTFPTPNMNGCDSVQTLELTVLPKYTFIQTVYICQGDSILIGNSYYNSSGSYTDSLSQVNGCDSLLITNLSILIYGVDLGSDVIICDYDSIMLNAGGGFASYLWSTGETTQTITVSDSAYYYVEATSSNGCVIIDSILVDTDNCASLSDLIINYGIKIYPNPSNGDFYLSANSNDIDFLIIDMKGAAITDVKNISYPYKVEGLSSGSYIIQFRKNGAVLGEEKIIVN